MKTKKIKETLRHKEAFEYYLYLGPGRTLKKVAKKFKVSEATAKRWSKLFSWQDRIVEREKAIAKRFSIRNEYQIIQIKEDNLRLLKKVKSKFETHLDKNEVPLKFLTDLERVLKLELLTIGEPTDHIKDDISIRVDRVITNSSGSPVPPESE